VAEPLVFLESDELAMSAATEALDRGGLVVFPTDTVYGVAARPDVSAATSAVFEAKSRPRDLTLPVLVSGLEAARPIAAIDERAASLAGRFWPGALTIVLPRTEVSLRWDLGATHESVAVRMPDHPVALGLLRRSGPLATTSANRSGEATPPDCDGVRAALGDSVDVYLCAGPMPAGTASTVVDLTGAEPRVLREGALAVADVLAAL
jgi:tRNA threonylcarbamoyl adenosine modification protein (Sua5/YciO/YrdC/YwlC family)